MIHLYLDLTLSLLTHIGGFSHRYIALSTVVRVFLLNFGSIHSSLLSYCWLIGRSEVYLLVGTHHSDPDQQFIFLPLLRLLLSLLPSRLICIFQNFLSLHHWHLLVFISLLLFVFCLLPLLLLVSIVPLLLLRCKYCQ